MKTQTILAAIESLIPARLSRESRQLLKTLLASARYPPAAAAIAEAAGFRNRYDMARRLRAEGLPSYRDLARTVRAVAWAFDACDRGSVSGAALASGGDPAPRYRVLKDVAGMPWSDVKREGPGVLVRVLLDLLYTAPPDQRPDVGIEQLGA